jgi:alkylated DNA repair dioxygenase AlkB
LKGFTLNEHNEAMKIEQTSESVPLEKTIYNKYVSELDNFTFDQLTVNDYMPGQGIPPHVDTHSPFEEVFVSLSLMSGVSMNFRTPSGE